MRVGKVTYTRSQPEVVLHMTVAEARHLQAALEALAATDTRSMPVLAGQLARVLEACRPKQKGTGGQGG